MWECPVCGQTFVTRNMPHSCLVVPLDEHFAHRPPELRAAFDALVAAAREHGPVTINATKSRITLQVRMRFAAVEPRRDHLRAHLVLKRRIEHPRLSVEHLEPDYYLHRFRLTSTGRRRRRARHLGGRGLPGRCAAHLSASASSSTCAGSADAGKQMTSSQPAAS